LRGVSKWPAVVGAGQRSRNTTERKHCPYRKDSGDCRRQVPIDGHIHSFFAVVGAAHLLTGETLRHLRGDCSEAYADATDENVIERVMQNLVAS
jgi:hypothetical protein